MKDQTYMGWYDARKDQTLTGRVVDATRRFAEKHGHEPAVALVNPKDIHNPGQQRFDLPELVPATWVPRGTVYVGPI